MLKSSLSNTSTDNLVTEIKLLKSLKNKFIVGLDDFFWDDKYKTFHRVQLEYPFKITILGKFILFLSTVMLEIYQTLSSPEKHYQNQHASISWDNWPLQFSICGPTTFVILILSHRIYFWPERQPMYFWKLLILGKLFDVL